MRAFYERWLWIMKIFFVEESRLSPRADKELEPFPVKDSIRRRN
jgi:hypothetical protein